MRRVHAVLTLFATIFIVLGLFSHALPAYAQEQTHTVQPGENLFRIALRFNVTVEALVALNGLPDASRIVAGQVLRIPTTGVVNATAVLPSAPAVSSQPTAVPTLLPPANLITTTGSSPYYHTVGPGDTLANVARMYGVSLQNLIAVNNIYDANQIRTGQRILIPGKDSGPTDPPAETTNGGATVNTLPGFPQVPPTPAVQPTAAPVQSMVQPVVNASTSASYKTHTVRPGESLASVARLYKVSWQTLAMLNGITDPDRIFTGTVLKIPADSSDPQAISAPGPVGASINNPTGVTGKWVKVVLSEQRVYLYENGRLLRNVLVSTGRAPTPTVIGDFKVYLKYSAQLMYGPGYYLPGVPWVLYFYQGYGLHGTYWHSNWGTPMSHGCVNMPTSEAKFLFEWAPVGTRVTVVW